MLPVIVIGVILVVIIAVVLVVVGRRQQTEGDPLQARLAEFSARETPVTLEEIELSQPFTERILLPIIKKVGEFATRFTPESSLRAIQKQLNLAGNPKGLDPVTFYAIRLVASVGLVVFVLIIAFISPADSAFSIRTSTLKALGAAVGAGAIGFFLPGMMLQSKIGRRQDIVIKAMPDALDLLTVCVEAGLGFDQAMQKVSEKWENELSMAFARVIQEIRLGKLRRDALKDMSERLDIPEMTSFVAALIQADQLGVSMAKVLRIQSEQMRMKRRQRAEKKAHEAPIKMLIPMAFLIFPSIYIVLLGPAAIQVMKQFF